MAVSVGYAAASFLKKPTNSPAAMTIFDAGVALAHQQVDPGEREQRAMALVFMITRPTRIRPRLRRPVGGGVADCLNARLLAVGDDRNARLNCLGLAQDRHLAIDTQGLRHFPLESLVRVIAHRGR
jgi:hypothetical protein